MNKRSFVVLALAAFFFAATLQLHGQALPAGTRAGNLQVGAAVSNAQTDEFASRISGITGFATFDFTSHLGVEADIHIMNIITPNDFVENTYFLGVRYVFHHGRFDPYVRVSGGIGQTSFQQPCCNFAPGTPGTYMALAGAAGLDIRLPRHITVRAIDFEYQMWPHFPPNGLNPTLISCGAAYRFR